MTPEEWRALAERAYGSWARGDPEEMIATVTPDVAFHPSGAFPDFTSDYVGHESMRRFWHELREPWEKLEIEVLDVELFEDDMAVVDIRFHGIGRGSGVVAELDFFQVTRTEGDLVAEITSHADRAEAIVAHGLRK